MGAAMSESTVLITGASSGIGAETAKYFSQQGQDLILIGRNSDRLQKVAKKLITDHHIFACDITNPQQLQTTLDKIHQLSLTKPLKHIINNAGAYQSLNFFETPPEEWTRQFEISLLAPTTIIKSLYSILKSQAPSSILNVSSTAALRPVSNMTAYSSLKAAMNSLSKNLALEFAKDQIRVNSICPGIVYTPIHEFYKEGLKTPPPLEGIDQLQPLGRVGTTQEIAEAIYFLTFKSPWTTGIEFIVDGGITLS